jgi:hypothetical protein
MAQSESRLYVEGFLTKNRAGMAFEKMHHRRFFTTEGFAVYYYSDERKSKVKGHFDLRNVTGLLPATDNGAGEGAVEIRIWVGDKQQKRMVISFTPDSRQRHDWLKHWCSAISPAYIHKQLETFANVELTAQLDARYGDAPAVAPIRALFARRAPTTKVLTPRGGGSTLQLHGVEAESELELDTPRGSADEHPMPEMPLPHTQQEDPNAGEVTFEITVPDGVTPGEKLQATTPGGVKVKLAVPHGAEPGTVLTFALPASVGDGDRKNRAAVIIQAGLRGTQARRKRNPSDIPACSIDEPVVKAALKVQKHYRGHTARNGQQEQSRLQWIAYYIQPEVAEWDEALALVCAPTADTHRPFARLGLAPTLIPLSQAHLPPFSFPHLLLRP